MEFINYKGSLYPEFQTKGNAAQYILPFARQICKGEGYDIGCAKKEWALPWSIPVDEIFNNGLDAYNLPDKEVDFIFSSHCLEHLTDWVYALEYWISKLKVGGVLLLYLPSYEQKYWRPWNNRKHYHSFTQEILRDFFIEHPDISKEKIFISGTDLNHSFSVLCIKDKNSHKPNNHKKYLP